MVRIPSFLLPIVTQAVSVTPSTPTLAVCWDVRCKHWWISATVLMLTCLVGQQTAQLKQIMLL